MVGAFSLMLAVLAYVMATSLDYERSVITSSAAARRTLHRLEAWGLNTGGPGRPSLVMLRWPSTPAKTS